MHASTIHASYLNRVTEYLYSNMHALIYIVNIDFFINIKSTQESDLEYCTKVH